MEEENIEEEFEKAEKLFNQMQAGGVVAPVEIFEEEPVAAPAWRFDQEHPDVILGAYNLSGERHDRLNWFGTPTRNLDFSHIGYNISSDMMYCYGEKASRRSRDDNRVDNPTWLIKITALTGITLTNGGKRLRLSVSLRNALIGKYGVDASIPMRMSDVTDLSVHSSHDPQRRSFEMLRTDFLPVYEKSLTPEQVSELFIFINDSLPEEIEAENKRRQEEEEKKAKAREEALARVSDRVKLISEICEFIYGDNFELRPVQGNEWKANSADRYKLTIHFPQIIIKNSKGRKHMITDLYVAFFFNELMEHTSGWHGIRGTLSLEEAVSGYSHSHLSRNCWSWSGFCLGSGEVTNIYADLIAAKFNPDTFRKAMLALLSYVEWESLEGGPYIRMSDIMGRSSRPTLPQIPNDATLLTLVKRVVDKVELPLNWAILPQNTGKFVINTTPDYEKTLALVLPRDLQVRRASNGTISPVQRDTSDSSRHISQFNDSVSSSSCNINYKGSTFRPQIQLDLEPESIAETIVMPAIVDKINGKIEELINLHYLKTI